LALLLLVPKASADLKDEVLARPSRETNKGLKAYQSGDAAQALAAFEKARTARPNSPATRFNEAVAQVKAGKVPEAIETFTALSREKNDLGFESHYNLGNAYLGTQQLPGAISSYRDALRLRPDDPRARRNLEIALRQLEQQKKDQEKDKPDQKDDRKDKQQQEKQPAPAKGQKDPPKTEKERESERFQKETGMTKDRAMQLLKALEQNEKMEQKKKLEVERAKRRKGKDW
jgi:tetratricopeptide (TPR) repeat protein